MGRSPQARAAAAIMIWTAFHRPPPVPSPMASVRAPIDAPKSPAPKWRASKRGWAAAMSLTRVSPRAVSINTSRPIGAEPPRDPSSSSSNPATRITSSGPYTLGIISVSSRPPAVATARTSSSIHDVSTALIRTVTVWPSAQSTHPTPSAAVPLAASFSSGATASSRSSITWSAPDRAALGNMSGRDPGTDSNDLWTRWGRGASFIPCLSFYPDGHL